MRRLVGVRGVGGRGLGETWMSLYEEMAWQGAIVLRLGWKGLLVSKGWSTRIISRLAAGSCGRRLSEGTIMNFSKSQMMGTRLRGVTHE